MKNYSSFAAGAIVAACILTLATAALAAGKPAEIEAAEQNLQQAQQALQQAGTKYGGHKEKALGYIQKALEELKQAEQFTGDKEKK